MKNLFSILLLAVTSMAFAQSNKTRTPPVKDEKKDELSLSGLTFRSVGPALTSGRIADFAVNPRNTSEYYIAVASGGVWKTINAGTTYEPVFDSQGSYSIGCVSLDPNNSNVVWVGSGENNNQRSVAYGDGVYKSADGGKSWKNMGLKNSEHIAKIIVDPKISSTVYVAAVGPLWKEGGERGIYKTTDGGKTWNIILKIDDHTGVTDLIMHPENPQVLYASSHQRRRSDYAYAGGGPGSAIHKTTDGGVTWEKVINGLPKEDLGRIGLAVSPADPEYLYAIVEAGSGESGFYRSLNQGASWEKRSSHATGGNYYSEIVCDPKDPEKVYSMTVYMQVSTDGGKNWRNAGEKSKHVDNHALWIDPGNTDHLLNGCDGGIYESWDGAQTWQYKPNLSVTQFYKVEVDNSVPFYYIYGGTQDNFSLGGPSRTRNESGITNSDWFVTNGGDGFESAIDPFNPNIVYAQSQHGGLVRFDKATGESTGIQPQSRKGENEYRWNWDSPLKTSPHKKGRVYFGANKIFKSDDYGSTWQVISEDISRNIDRNNLPMMGRIWGIDAPGRNSGTALYGTASAFSESSRNENLLVVGTDDGLVQVTADGGQAWRKSETFPGAPSMTYVYDVQTSQHNENVIFAVLNNHKRGDFKPYIYRSTDQGISWIPISGNLPERGSVYSLAEDHVDPLLLFAGTEFGVFYSNDGGQNWKQLKSGLPTIAIRDIAIQKREHDLVLASFGRGFYVLDDYSPLRHLKSTEGKEGVIFPIKDSWMFVENSPLGIRGKGFMGESFFQASNPPVGAVFSYYFNEEIKTLKEKRQEEEKKLYKDAKDVAYPSYEKLKAENQEEKSYLLFTIRNNKNEIVRKLKTSPKKGVQRIVWDFRYPTSTPVVLDRKPNDNPFAPDDVGQLATPGEYKVTLSKVANGVFTDVAGPQNFTIRELPGTSLPASDRSALVAWQREAAKLQRSITGTTNILTQANDRLKYMKEAVFSISTHHDQLTSELKALETKLSVIQERLNGDRIAGQLDIDKPPSITSRLNSVIYSGYNTTSDPTSTMKDQLTLTKEEYTLVLSELRAVIQNDMKKLEDKLEESGAPYTPGRIPLLKEDEN